MGTFMTPSTHQQWLALNDQLELNGQTSLRDYLNSGDEEEVEVPSLIFIKVDEDEDDLKSVASLEQKLNDFGNLMRTILDTGGMSQNLALEAQAIDPTFAGGLPINYYTKMPTATQYQASLEALSAGIWALIAAAVTALVAFIYKIFKTFADTPENAKKKLHSTADRIKQAPERLHETAETINRGNDLLRGDKPVFKDAAGKEFQCNSFQAAIDKYFTDQKRYDRIKHFLKAGDPLFYDMVENGPYSKAIVAAGRMVEPARNVIAEKIRVLKDIVKRDIVSGDKTGQQHFNNHKLDKLEIVTMPFIGEGQFSLMDISKRIEDLHTETLNAKTEKDIPFDRLFDVVSRAYASKDMDKILDAIASSMEHLEGMETDLKNLEIVCHNLAHDDLPGSVTSDVGQHIREIIVGLTKDISGYRFLIAHVTSYATGMQRWHTTMLGMALEVVKKVSTEYAKTGKEIPHEWVSVLQDMKQHAAEIRTLVERFTP